MASIIEITNPLTGAVEQVDKLDHTAQQIDDGLNIARGVSNPNILDNWYFGNPVNQRGQTSYTGAGHGIDRWTLNGGTLLIEDDCISIIGNDLGVQQLIPTEELVAGAVVTFSVLSKSGSGAITVIGNGVERINVYISDGITSTTIRLPDSLSGNYEFWFYSTSNEPLKIKAAKLELGTTQTLAHQDENGVWQLNEITDFGEQLARCQRYLYVAKGTYRCSNCDANNGCFFPISIPVKMRATPSLIMPSSFIVLSGITNNTISTFVNHKYSRGISESAVQINLKDTSNNKYSIDYSIYCNDNPIYISAEL